MKTPREILLCRRQSAQPHLDAIRSKVVVNLNKRSATHDRSLPVVVVFKLWCELILPSRRIWTGLATIWLAILLVNVSIRDTSPVMARKSSPTPELMLTFQQQERLLAELTEPHEFRTAEPPKRSTLQPRSERREKIATA